MERFSLLLFLVLTSACVMKAHAEILSPYYYQELCPIAEEIVKQHVESEVYRDPNVAAQLLRLHFHDCFVMVNTFS
jgi:peroxidase